MTYAEALALHRGTDQLPESVCQWLALMSLSTPSIDPLTQGTWRYHLGSSRMFDVRLLWPMTLGAEIRSDYTWAYPW